MRVEGTVWAVDDIRVASNTVANELRVYLEDPKRPGIPDLKRGVMHFHYRNDADKNAYLESITVLRHSA